MFSYFVFYVYDDVRQNLAQRVACNRSRGSKRTEISLLRYNFFVKIKLHFTENCAIEVTGGYGQLLIESKRINKLICII